MNNNGGNYVYALGLDTAAFASSVDKAKRMFQGLGNTATAAGEEADEAFNKMKNSIASVAAGVSLGMLAKKVAEVRGEVQQLEVAFETMLGSKQKADALMAQMVELAAKTPFGLQDVTNGAKQLLAFGSASEEVASEITMLGDIASGLSIPLGDLIYLYGTTRTQGALFTQDLRQFMSRGIPLADELAKVMGKSTEQVRELVSAGKVGFPEVLEALKGMTSEGGQFGGLMEKQAQTITGQISALQDAIYQMFNEIGESSEGVINSVLSGAGAIVENYEKILDILTVLIATYGTYKAAVIATAAVQKAAMIAKEAQAFFQLAKGVKSAQEAMLLLNAATRKNPWGLVLSAITAVVAAIWAYCESTEEATETTDELSEAMERTDIGAKTVQVMELSDAYKKLGDDMNARKKFITENKEAFDKLGVSVQSVAEANRLLIDSTPAFVESLRLQAQAAAAKGLAEEKFAERDKKSLELERARKELETIPEKIDVGAAYTRTRYGVVTTGRRYADNPAYISALENISTLESEIAALNETANSYFDTSAEKLKESAEKLKELGVDSNNNGGGSGDGDSEEERRLKQLVDAKTKLAVDAIRTTTEAEINAMEEGIAKKLKQIDYEYDEEERKIAEREAQLRELGGGRISDGDAKRIAAMRSANESSRNIAKNAAWEAELAWGDDTDVEMKAATEALKEELDKRNKAWMEYAIKYGTFQERFKATQDKYSRLIANAQTEGERKALEAERDAALAAFEVQASAWAKDLANKSIAELNKMMQELEEQVEAKQEAFDAIESSDSAEAKNYLKTINELKAKIAELKKQLSGASKEAKGGNWEGAAQIVQGIASAASDAAGALEGVDDELANTINGMAKFANVAASLVSAIAAVATASTALNMALGVIGLIATAIQVVSTAIGSIMQANSEFRETLNKIKELNKELAQMRELSRIDSVEGTIFGSDAFGNFANNLSVLRDATTELNKSREAIRLWARDKFAELGFDEDTLNLLEFENYVDALKEMRVKLKDAGKFAEAFGAKDEYADLGDIFPELFGDEGVTLEGLQKLKDSDIWEKLSKEHRDLIDQMIKDWEVFNESTQAVTAYLTDIFGEMGNSINDAIVEAFMNGSDAALEFGDIAGQVIENLIKQVGYSAYIAPILTQAMADVEALNGQGLSSEEYLNALMGIVGDAMKVAGENVEAYNEFLENADQYAESVGINTFDSERSAQSKGIAQASQDSVDELNGRMTAIQGHTYSLMEGQRQLINDSAQVLRHLAGIESNTAELRQMRLDMAAMRSDISDIATRGIITR